MSRYGWQAGLALAGLGQAEGREGRGGQGRPGCLLSQLMMMLVRCRLGRAKAAQCRLTLLPVMSPGPSRTLQDPPGLQAGPNPSHHFSSHLYTSCGRGKGGAEGKRAPLSSELRAVARTPKPPAPPV